MSLTEELALAPSTVAILGMPLSEKHRSYHNKRALQDGVRSGKEKEVPNGLQWNGNYLDLDFSIQVSIILINH